MESYGLTIIFSGSVSGDGSFSRAVPEWSRFNKLLSVHLVDGASGKKNIDHEMAIVSHFYGYPEILKYFLRNVVEITEEYISFVSQSSLIKMPCVLCFADSLVGRI